MSADPLLVHLVAHEDPGCVQIYCSAADADDTRDIGVSWTDSISAATCMNCLAAAIEHGEVLAKEAGDRLALLAQAGGGRSR